MVGELNHIELYVSDLKRSIEFWQWLLENFGYKKYQEWPKGKSYKLKNTYIVFVQTEEKYLKPKYHRKRIGLNHIAFSVDKKLMVKIKKDLKEKEIGLLYKD